MRKFFSIIPYDCDSKFAQVTDYKIDNYDFTVLWQGEYIPHKIPASVKLFIGSGNFSDYVGNPLSWQIGSSRFADILVDKAGNDIQLFDAPIFELRTGSLIVGYKVVNVTQCVKCLDFKRSKISWNKDNPSEICAINTIAIHSNKVPEYINLFRIEEWPYVVIFSEELVRKFAKNGFQGFAFEICRTTI